MNNLITGIYTIWLRDLLRFWRDKSRIFGAIVQPTLYLFILGIGMSSALGQAQASLYIKFIYPGIIGMSLLFTSIFSAISIIWDREFGFLREVLVAPIPRASIAIGKVLGGASVASIQGTILLIYAPILGIKLSILLVLKIVPMLFLISFSLTSLGVLIAARMRSMEGFQMIMNFLMMPMFFLSGAMFPLKGLPTWLSVLTKLDPLTYGVDALRNIFAFAKHAPVEALLKMPKGPPPLGGGILEARIGLFKPVYNIYLDIVLITLFGFLMLSIAVILFERQD